MGRHIRDDLYWLALTVYQEAAGEPFQGQLAVAWVIVTRAGEQSISDTVLRKLQFSCWNADAPTRQRVDSAEDDPAFLSCYKAACAAYFGLLADPTRGATHYLAEGSLPTLPTWFDRQSVRATIGAHTFLRVA